MDLAPPKEATKKLDGIFQSMTQAYPGKETGSIV